MSSSDPPVQTFLGQSVSLLGSAASWMRLPAIASTASPSLRMRRSFTDDLGRDLRHFANVVANKGVAAVLTSLLYFKQKALIYPSHMPPNARTDVPKPSQFGIHDFEELFIPTDDGEKLSAFYIRGPRDGRNANVTVLMFHGNAGNIGHRLPIARMLIDLTGCNVFMLEYRGYGLSTGEPGESGICHDAQTALDYLRNRAETSEHKLVVYGQSLGGAVSVKLVAENQKEFVGLVLENTFLSMRKLIPSVLPPARYLSLLCHQVWPSDSIIPSINKVPILFLSGLQDEIVPPSHMRRLYELSQAPNKIFKPLPNGDHNSSVLEDGYFESIADFIASVTQEYPSTPPEKSRM